MGSKKVVFPSKESMGTHTNQLASCLDALVCLCVASVAHVPHDPALTHSGMRGVLVLVLVGPTLKARGEFTQISLNHVES